MRVHLIAVVAAASLIAAACSSGGGAEALERLNSDPVFALVPPGAEIYRSVLPDECPVGSDSSEASNEVLFTFEGEQPDVVAFYRTELATLDWEVSGERPQREATAIDAQKEIDGDSYALTVTVGRDGGSMRGTTPPGTC
jgi:hypothetical protein